MSFLLYVTLALGLGLLISPWMRRLHLPAFIGCFITGSLLSLGFSLQLLQPQLDWALEGILFAFMLMLGLHIDAPSLLKLKRPTWLASGLTFLSLTLIGTLVGVLLLEQSVLISMVLACILAWSSSALLFFNLNVQQQEYSNFTPSAIHQSLIQISFVLPVLLIFELISTPFQIYQDLATIMAFIMVTTGLFLFKTYLLQPLKEHIQASAPELAAVVPMLLIAVAVLLGYSLDLNNLMIGFITGILLGDLQRQQLNPQTRFRLQHIVYAAVFVMMATQLNLAVLTTIWLPIVYGVLALLSLKFINHIVVYYYFQHRWRKRAQQGLYALHGSEIGLVLLCLALQLNLIQMAQFQYIGWVLIFTMLLSPCWIYVAQRWFKPNAQALDETVSTENPPQVLIAGFGRMGQVIARVAHLQQIPFSIVDNHHPQADFIQTYGGQFYSGDATDIAVLQQANIHLMKIFVLAIDDIEDSMNVARYLTLNHPELLILARARDRHHARLLSALGIEHIWRESHASALDIAQQLLCGLGMQENLAAEKIHQFKQHDAEIFQQQLQTQLLSNTLSSGTQTLDELEHLFSCDAEYHLLSLTETETETETEHIASR